MDLRTDFSADARLAAIVDSSFDAIVSKDLNSIVTTWNAAAVRMFGYSAEEMVGQSILKIIPVSMHAEERAIIESIRAGERVQSFDTKRQAKDGHLIDVSITVSPILNAYGEIVGASKIARDISAAREAEQRIRVLMREVNHRMKNQFSVILSIIRESSNLTRSPEEFHHLFRERIFALSRSHDLLVDTNWTGATLHDLANAHLRSFGRDDAVNLSGPTILLSPNAVQNLGMAFHELATNSVKYGALSTAGGTIDVRWWEEPQEDMQMLRLVWSETGSSIVPPNELSRRGFGTVVLTKVVPRSLIGTAEIARENNRLTWKLSAPVQGLTLG